MAEPVYEKSSNAPDPTTMPRRVGILLLLPALLLALFTLLVPSIATGILSFQRDDLLMPPQFVGWNNYAKLFTNDPTFTAALGFTGNLVVWRVAAVAVVPLLLA